MPAGAGRLFYTGLGRFTVSLVLSHFGSRSQEKQERRQLSLAVTENSCDSNMVPSDHESSAMVHFQLCKTRDELRVDRSDLGPK